MSRSIHPRGRAIALALFGLALPLAAAQAQDYPTREIHLICPFAPGSGADVLTRYFAEKIRPLAGRTIIVENKTGAGSNIAIEYTARSKPDGYTILISGAGGVASSMSLFKKPPVDVGNALQIAGTMHRIGFMLTVAADQPYRGLADLTAALKAKGAKASYATGNQNGTVMGELYKAYAGLEAVEVNYKSPANSLNDQLSGAVDFGVFDPGYSLAQQRAGRLRILAVSTATRLRANPEIPTMAEQGVPMDLVSWFAAMVPAGTPRPILDQISGWFAQVVATDETRAFLAGQGGDPYTLPIDDAQDLFRKNIEIWKDYVRIAKIQPEG
jgi:tripartite-type tricarboxylate transporter receptor subunit TctC